MRKPSIGGLVAAGILIAAGCAGDHEPDVRIAAPGPIPATAQRSGDPDRGYRILTEGGYVSCGIPYQAWRAGASPASAAPPLPGRTGRAAQLPYDLNLTIDDDGVEVVVTNCLTCHASHFDDELVIGLGDAFRDFSVDLRPPIELLGLFVDDGAPAAAWQRWADRMLAIAPYMRTGTVGVNPAPNLTMALMAHRDPQTLEWHAEPRLRPPPREPLPTKVPPWWRMGKRHSLFHHGGGRGDHTQYMMLKSLLCTDDVAEAQRIDEWFTHVRAYIASLEPPEFPYPVDREQAAVGERVFESHCAECHGRYGDEPAYPNLLIGLDEVGTDSAYANQAIESDRFIDWFNRSFYGRRGAAVPGAGYVAPPLDGVWATAPYLHNGSVPTIAQLLDSVTRPQYWRHVRSPRSYDPDTLGWHHQVLDHGKDGAASTDEARYIYDTTRPGHGNRGHEFGDLLSADERRALIEYLKTL